MSAFSAVLTAFVGFLVAVLSLLGITVLANKRFADWFSGEQMCRALCGIFRNYARHGTANAIRVLECTDGTLTPSDLKMLKKQIYSDKEIQENIVHTYGLFTQDVIYKILHFSLLLRNFNLHVDHLINAADPITALDVQAHLLTRNLRLALIAHRLADGFDELLVETSFKAKTRREKAVKLVPHLAKRAYFIVATGNTRFMGTLISPRILASLSASALAILRI